jgi:SAM-dependent methyltransferase
MIISQIFEKMRSTEMNNWVGGSDPEAVGDASAEIVRRLMPVSSESRVLDLGCGIGRGMLSLLRGGLPAQVVGMDIMPPVISFCQENIAPHFPQVSFDLIEGSNDHYDQFIDGAARKPLEQVKLEYKGIFNIAYAFSVFTHVDRKDFVDLLKLVETMLAPGGYFLFTCFTLNEFSRKMIDHRQTIFPLVDKVYVDGGDVLWGDKADPLAFIAFDKALIEAMAWEAGLAIMKVEYGCWMGGGIGSSLQDVVIVRKPLPMAGQNEIEFTPIVDRAQFQSAS